MRKVERSEVLPLGEYETIRPRFLERIIAAKKHRRLAAGDHMTFIWENRDTVLFQIQEMLRVERITREKAVQYEIDTYNELVPGDGELFATLMIEYDDAEERSRALEELANLKDHVRLRLGPRIAPARFELLPGEEEDRLPAVNYARFRVGPDAAAAQRDPSVPCTLEITHPAYPVEARLPDAMRAELADDLEEP